MVIDFHGFSQEPDMEKVADHEYLTLIQRKVQCSF